MIHACRIGLVMVVAAGLPPAARSATPPISPDDLQFFETRVRPVLANRCYSCHSGAAKTIEAGLRLDSRAGWQSGGDSGEPAIVPGKPADSPLIRAIRHDDGSSPMPPKQAQLPAQEIADLTAWVERGAPDPRDEASPAPGEHEAWETAYHERLQWWSLQPLTRPSPPAVKASTWVRNDVDRFVLAALEDRNLEPAAPADRRVLARRLSFALTGLPPTQHGIDHYLADSSAEADRNFVQTLLNSPHFGEHWARHWMDVVHYTDTHGYEWDVPAKNAWMYRDYLTRAWNADVPFRQLIIEQLAGDLIEPRIDATTGLNESLIGPMALRLGERRHGDNAAAEGVTQEAIANIIDTVSKGFLATTVACAQCHDHKLDAIAQQDYYALAGVFQSTRWGARCVDAADNNERRIDELRKLKQAIRAEIAARWLNSRDSLTAALAALPEDKEAANRFPESLTACWQRLRTAPLSREAFDAERARRSAENNANLKLLADFTRDDRSHGWRWEGSGLRHGLVRDGEPVVAADGDAALEQILPAGRWSHVWSKRLAGALRSPLFNDHTATTISVGAAGGQQAGYAMLIDQAFHSERLKFLSEPLPAWLTITAGNFDTLEGSIDTRPRRVVFELATKSLNNYFPPRVGYGGVKEADEVDPRSWFGVTRIYEHPAGKPPLDDLARFAPLFADDGEPATRFADVVLAAVDRWARDECNTDDALLLADVLHAKLLPNEASFSPRLAELVTAYRAVERELEPDRVIGTAADWNEARDEHIGVRGSYTEFGAVVPRGNIRFLGGAATRQTPASTGRLELAHNLASNENPLTARVFVNRVWLHLFGEGLVRTPDDFGHLGQTPSHPELLDYLAQRFIDEGWSLKKLVAFLVDSATWRQSGIALSAAMQLDPENRLWHHLPLRRLEAESLRDTLLAVSGRLDPTLYGPPIDPYRTATDAAKRLACGPLDGHGRRSIYLKMTLMEPPRFLAVFNQPIPRLTRGRRDVTNVPTQALTLLNDPFVIEMSRVWSEHVLHDGASTPADRAARMFERALGRPPQAAETARLVELAAGAATLRGANADQLMTCQPAWQDVAHAIFNLKEFIYVP